MSRRSTVRTDNRIIVKRHRCPFSEIVLQDLDPAVEGLSADETVCLATAEGVLLDRVKLYDQSRDVSYGRAEGYGGSPSGLEDEIAAVIEILKAEGNE